MKLLARPSVSSCRRIAGLVVVGLLASASPLLAQTLAWNPNAEPDLSGYSIAYGTQPGSTSVSLDVGNVTSRTLTGLQAGVTYYFRVQAYNTAGQFSAPSTEVSYAVPGTGDTSPPTAPATLTATASSSTQIGLNWGASTDNVGVVGYRVERCTGAGCTSFTQIATPTTTSHADAGLTASTTYTYRVRAVDAAGNVSPYSGTAAATTTAASTGTSIWPASTIPTTANVNDATPIEIGVKFRATTSGFITGVRFYKGALNTGTHLGRVWTTSGTLLQSATFTGETASGWQQVTFATPVAVTANTMYVASYYAPSGRYSENQAYFASSGATSGVLEAPSTAAAGGNGVYRYVAGGGFPSSSWNGNNYWVDVVFSGTTGTPDTTAPTAPATLTATASSSSQVALTWSAATDNLGVTGYRIERCTGAGCTSFVQVATATGTTHSDTGLTASTTYRYRVRAVDAAANAGPYSPIATAVTSAAADTTAPTAPGTLTATASSSTQIALSWAAATDNVAVTGYRVERCTGAGCTTFAQVATPASTTYADAGLTASTTYRYRVRAVDAAGNVGAYSGIATATTSASTSCPCTIWPDTTVPATASTSSATAIEIGVKFRATTSGFITGVRFYKGASNTGTHLGRVWTTSGTQLQSATFTGETASGWQQVTFATPVAVTANTIYVASYYAPNGRYSENRAYFTTNGTTRGPLEAPSSAAAGGNGVYRYGTGGGFPSSSWNGNNYWIDVVFTTTAPAALSTALTPGSSTIAEPSADAASAPVSDTSTARRTTDADGDGLPDAWERQYALSAAAAVGDDGATGDPDRDGISNLDEYARGSHPRGLVSRYLAEGLTGLDVGTQLVIVNPGPVDATVLVSFSDTKGQTTRVSLTLAAGARRVLDVGAIPALAAATFSTVVESDQVVTVERAMIWARTAATTTAPAIDAAGTHWYFATGSTLDAFELYYLVQNPGDAPAEVQVRYLLPNGQAPVTRVYSVAPFSRATIWVDREDPALSATDVAAEFSSLTDTPIVVERSMYVTSGQPVPAAVASSAGLTAAAAEWVLDRTDARAAGTTSVVIANPGTEPVSVEVTSVFEGDRRVGVTHVVPAGGRLGVKLGGGTSGLVEPVVGIEVRSTNGAPIVVEQSGPVALAPG